MDSMVTLGAVVGGVFVAGLVLQRVFAPKKSGSPRLSPEVSKLEAIRAYRQLHGVGLKEAREAIEQLPPHQWPKPFGGRTQGAADNDPDIRELVKEGRIIDAVKRYRDRTGVSLTDAKQAIDRIRAEVSRG